MRQRHEILHRDSARRERRAQPRQTGCRRHAAPATAMSRWGARAPDTADVVRAFRERRRDVSDHRLRFVLRIARRCSNVTALPGAAIARRGGRDEADDAAPRIAAACRARLGRPRSSTRRGVPATGNCAAARCCRPAARRCAPFPALRRTIGLRRRGTDRSTASDRRRRTASARRPAPNPP